jgi:hypothetical protein
MRRRSRWHKVLFGTAMLTLTAFGAQAQTQPFSAAGPYTTDLGFTGTGSFYTTMGASGTGAYGTATTATIDFAERVIARSTSGSRLTFELANPVGNFTSASSVKVFISIDRGAFSQELEITSNTSNNYAFGASFPGNSTNITTSYTGSNTLITVNGSSQRPVTSVTITLPAAPATYGRRVAVRIELTAASGAVLLVDNVALLTSAGSPLPVELTRFDATAKPQGVRLDWATASEKNSDRFEIQRSATGEAYQTIGTVKSQGTSSSATTYSFVDGQALSGRAYYRLRQVDADGTAAYSPVVTAQALAGAEMTPYPNPSPDVMTLPAALGAVQYRVFNAMGQTLLTGKAAGNDRLDISSLPKGPFFLELTGETGRTTQRLVRE